MSRFHTAPLLLCAATLAVSGCASTPTPARPAPPAAAVTAAPPLPVPPLARRELVSDELFGTVVADPYRWLEDVTDPRVRGWVDGQDAAARARLERMPGRDQLADRFRELFYVDSYGVPVERGGRYFFRRTHADREKAIVYWQQGLGGEPRVLLDPNGWSEDGTVSLGVWVPSHDGTKVVYARRENAADEATLYVLDVDRGTTSEVDVIPGGKYAYPSWTPDGRGFYYEFLPTDPSIPVDARPGYTEVRYHALGTDPKADPLVRPRTGDPSTFLSQSLSRDGRWLFAYVQRGWNENDVWVRDLKNPAQKDFRLLVEGRDATYSVEAFKDRFYVLTDEGAPTRRVFRVDPARPARAQWQEVVPADPKATLEQAYVVGGRLVLSYLRDASSEVRLADLDGGRMKAVELPGIGSIAGVGGRADSDELFFSFNSFTTPPRVYRASVKEGRAELWRQVELPIRAEDFVVEQVFYPSKDGTRVSLFLVHHKDVKPSGDVPTLLYGYGGFNVSLTPGFRSSIFPWLEAGGLYAVANLRGGGEYGKSWHDAGKGANKQNVFDDFAAAAEYLHSSGWTRPDKLAIYGGSNGGLLVGAAMTQRPELFGAVVCAVPLLDMVRYHLFGSGRTWIPEYGTAEREEDFRVLHAYSPYHHVQEGVQYPSLLMLAADSDDRVDPMHARKFVAAVQGAGGHAVLRVERNAGHGGADLVRQAIDQSADMYAFLFDRLGVAQPESLSAGAR